MNLDTLFKAKRARIDKFEFNQQVAQVFDDMVSRSVPFYHEIHRMIEDLLSYHLKDGHKIYDLGCSTGSTIKLVHQFAKKQGLKNVQIIGVDNSQSMILMAQKKLAAPTYKKNVELICKPIEEIEFEKCDLIIMNYTMQFISPGKRQAIAKKIHKSLRPGGLFILSEKIKSPNRTIHDLITDLYYDFKRRNGYSEMEIAQKRQALENVLRPSTPEQNIQLLKKAGFKKSEMIFRWHNFASFISIK